MQIWVKMDWYVKIVKRAVLGWFLKRWGWFGLVWWIKIFYLISWVVFIDIRVSVYWIRAMVTSCHLFASLNFEYGWFNVFLWEFQFIVLVNTNQALRWRSIYSRFSLFFNSSARVTLDYLILSLLFYRSPLVGLFF